MAQVTIWDQKAIADHFVSEQGAQFWLMMFGALPIDTFFRIKYGDGDGTSFALLFAHFGSGADTSLSLIWGHLGSSWRDPPFPRIIF